jgi:hypothetical protein
VFANISVDLDDENFQVLFVKMSWSVDLNNENIQELLQDYC